MAMEIERKLQRLGFTELLLGGVIVLIITLAVIAMAFYVNPAENLDIPEVQPAIRVAREADFLVGSSRIRSWGDEVILIVRLDSSRYFALQATSPADGCILRWDPESSRIYSPCRYMVYDLRGDVVAGLSTQALKRFAVSVREGVIYVSEGAR
ncbi:MAG: Rieske (2Fe-2S) protein [Gemmatimonadales bacterium]|jgi:nitrite reductase/ring-hydroxylating ferredoxin subunit